MRKLLPLLAVCLSTAFSAASQCSTANINWDALDFIPSDGYGMANALAVARNQAFAIGKNSLNISYTVTSSVGENTSHSGETGADVQFTGNGKVTLTFATAVSGLKFTIYDIDKGQSIAFTATNGGVPAVVNLSKADPASAKISITGSIVTSLTGNEPNSDNATSVRVDIAGDVTTVELDVTGSDSKNGGSSDQHFWLSGISACVTGNYAQDYYRISRPYNGMPGYVLVSINKGVYMVDPVSGKAKLIFTDGATSGTINSLAYDPYNKVVYYTWSLTNNGSANASEKTLRKYDFKKTNPVPETVLTDVNSIRLPTLAQGVESGAAAFYDGSLYIGIEGGADGGNGDVGGGGGGGGKPTSGERESIIWRVDFDGNGNAIKASQVWATSGNSHDWSDFAIVDGILYDSNGEAGAGTYYHYNLQSGVNTPVPITGGTAPKQTSVGWDDKIYWVSNQIGQYDLAGGVTGKVNIVGTPTPIPNWSNTTSPSFGDGAEAFRPKADFGDAPNSFDRYDIDTLSPALHEISPNLRLGNNLDDEWNKPALVYGDATEDGGDEDGLAYARIFVNGSNYESELRVYNNTGGNATVCAWIDLNDDKMFQPEEGIMQTVGSSTTVQTVNLVWNNPVSVLPNNSFTYLRIRITSQANGMTQANPIGYFADGEVEDYYVFVSNTPLDVKLTDFSAKKVGEKKVNVSWTVTDEEKGTRYELQKSGNSQDWSVIDNQVAQNDNAKATYEHMDAAPFVGDNYYRLKISEADGSVHFSAIRRVLLEKSVLVQITPNPASANVRLSIQTDQRAPAHVRIVDMNGRTVYERDIVVEEGENGYTLPVSQLPAGMYQAEVRMGTKRHTQQLIVRK